MNLGEYQKKVDNWIKEETDGYWSPQGVMLRLVEEVGELAREVNHRFGEKKRKNSDSNREISDEVGDVFFTLMCFSNALKIDMGSSLDGVLKKYTDRDKGRHKRA